MMGLDALCWAWVGLCKFGFLWVGSGLGLIGWARLKGAYRFGSAQLLVGLACGGDWLVWEMLVWFGRLFWVKLVWVRFG